MRLLVLASLLLAPLAVADVGPAPPKCTVPAGCTTCVVNLGTPDSGTDCIAGAADAGLVDSACFDRSGASVSHYYCPPATPATRPGCGCTAIDPLALGAFFVLAPLLRRRARR